MKKILKTVAIIPFCYLPISFLYLLIRAVLLSIQQRTPQSALRILFAIEDDLSKCINQLAIAYDGGVHAKHRLMQYHDFFVHRIKPEERVLDIGCGYGAVAYSIASRADAQVIGIDMNRDNIRKAKSFFEHPNLSFIEGNALTDLPSDSFDVIVISNVLEHIENRVEFLRMAQTRLKPHRWLIRVPMFNRRWEIPLRKELGIFYFSDATHYIEYTEESFRLEMENGGLAITHLQINWGEIWAEVRSEEQVLISSTCVSRPRVPSGTKPPSPG